MSRDDDRTWAELVESFHASSSSTPPDESRRWPAAEDIDAENDQPSITLGGLTDGTDHAGLMPTDFAELQPADAGTTHEGFGGGELADHFVPPTPPPIPRGDGVTRAAWWGVLGSPAIFLLIVIAQWTPHDWMLLGLAAAFVAGFSTLVARLRGHQPDDPDNGAVI